MKYTKGVLLLTLFLVFLSTCREEEEAMSLTNFTTVYGIEDYEQAEEELKNYALFGVYTDGVTKLFLEQSEALGDAPKGEIFTKYRSSIDADRSDGGTFYINDIESIYQPEGYYSPSIEDATDRTSIGQAVKSMLGKENRFRLIRAGETIYDNTIYLPAAIEVDQFSNTGIVTPNTYNYGVSRSNFSFSWNADRDNTNGILVVLVWDGNTTETPLDQLAPDYYYKAAWLEDSGNGSVPSSFFAEVPQNAMFRLHFYRANFEIVTGEDGQSYKLYSMTDDWKQCVLMD